MEQEHCPNCGTLGRPGAKFCATCGHAFSPAGDTQSAFPHSGLTSGTTRDSDPPADANAEEDAPEWPPAPAPAPAEPFFGSGWDQQSSAPPASFPDQNGESVDKEATLWRDMATDSWPSAPAVAIASPDPEPEDTPLDRTPAFDPAAAVEDVNASHTQSAEALVRAEGLLEELRQTIGILARGATLDLSGVISDLEVAVTPPGALPPDDVTELREALLAARERPRDVDTIVDLTKRVDAMVSLVIAYDRAIAAIERSLDVLKNEGDGVSG